MTSHELRKNTEILRRLIRTGDFSRVNLLKRCWDNRAKLREGELDSLRLHTIAWEMHRARGEYKEATARLLDRGEIEAGAEAVYKESRNPDQFAKQYFPRKLSRKARKDQYDFWRQRAMGALAMAADEFLLDAHRRNETFDATQKFLEQCFGAVGFSSVGTRSRLHYFRGNSYAANYEHKLAAVEYDLSLSFCIDRAKERMQGNRDAATFEVERAFAVYCLGKLELAFGQLDFHRGHLDSAKRHAKRAGLLLQTSNDPYLPRLAQLLTCLIERYQENFGWDLVTRMFQCSDDLKGHTPYQLEANLEAVKTCVYLRNHPRPLSDSRSLSPEEALKRAISIAGRAQRLGLKNLHFHALLVQARTLNRLTRFDDALRTVDDAEKALHPHVPRPMQAEASFVRGKIYATRGSKIVQLGIRRTEEDANIRMIKDDATALDHFQKASGVGASITFGISCNLQIVEMLLRLGRITEASRLLAETRRNFGSVQHTFLDERLRNLEKQIDKSEFSEFHYVLPLFSLDDARKEMEKKFLLAIERQTDLPPHEFLRNYKRKIAPLLRDLNYDRLKKLVEDHFPACKQSSAS